jgi:hypothetical protein
MPRTRPIPTTQKYRGYLEATSLESAILAEYTYCKADPRRGTLFFFFFFFGFSSIRDTVLLSPPRSFKQQLLLPDKRTHDHY